MNMTTRRKTPGAKSPHGVRPFPEQKKEPKTTAIVVSIPGESVVSSLAKFGPLDESSKKELKTLLKAPNSLFVHIDGQSAFSASSDKTLVVNPVLHDLLDFKPVPKDIPDYGIVVGWAGANQFCTFVDKRRKIIVIEAIRSAFSENGSWPKFLTNLRNAIDESARVAKTNKRFDFVISQDGLTTLI